MANTHTAIDKLLDQMKDIYGSNKKIPRHVTREIRDNIRHYAQHFGMNVEGYRVSNPDINAVLRTVKKEMLDGNTFTNNSPYPQLVALALLKGVALKSNAPEEEIDKLVAAIDRQAAPIAHPNHRNWAGQDNFNNASDKLPECQEKFLGGGIRGKVGQGVVTVGAIALIVNTVKSAFKPKPQIDEQGQVVEKKPGFWQTVGNLALAGGIAYLGYNVGIKGKSIGQTISDTRSWVERVAKTSPTNISFGRAP